MHQAPRNLDNYQTHILDHQRIQSQNHSLRHANHRVGLLCNTNPEKIYHGQNTLCLERVCNLSSWTVIGIAYLTLDYQERIVRQLTDY